MEEGYELQSSELTFIFDSLHLPFGLLQNLNWTFISAQLLADCISLLVIIWISDLNLISVCNTETSPLLLSTSGQQGSTLYSPDNKALIQN